MNRKSLFGIVGVVILSAVMLSVQSVQAGNLYDTTVKGVVTVDNGGVIDTANGTFKIGGTTVTATAAQLNAVNAGASITGNIPVASITNAAGSVGASIGGNIPVAAITNALAGTAYTTNTLTGDGVTNQFIWATVGGVKVLFSITTSP